MRSAIAPLGVLLVMALAAGCGGDEGGGADPSALEGVPWVLASGVDVEGWEAVAPGATFQDGTVRGSTGCNRFMAGYRLDGDALRIDTIASTRMACPPPADAVERAYVAALGKVRAWRTDDEGLALLDAEARQVLRYRAATPVGSWTATAIQFGGGFTSPISGTAITASFGDDGVLSGSAGCNTYTATYASSRGAIEITAPAATFRACAAPEGIMDQEAAYLASLAAATRYRVEGGSLDLLRADGTFVASYAPEPAVAAPSGSG